ncbi:hypothetical protein XA68_17664 [Ophiocordyceps unilateralis]|uniref:Uncharacterized protein n=1 Tax=Ophiocordyceps unilateralis TaxID=268505 RepID=A0A2A9PIU5_OPHUN|nr:hypothetical protein XA68_17664 [Ophiocordyceps unilateralis]
MARRHDSLSSFHDGRIRRCLCPLGPAGPAIASRRAYQGDTCCFQDAVTPPAGCLEYLPIYADSRWISRWVDTYLFDSQTQDAIV